MSEAAENVEAEFVGLWEAAVMVLDGNARRPDSEKLEAALIAVEEE